MKTIDNKLMPALEGINAMKFKPAEDLNDIYEDLFLQAMSAKGLLKNADAEAYMVLQDWAFGKLTKREALSKLERLDYIEWEVV